METKLPGPIELLKEAIGITRDRFWTLVGIILIPSLLGILVGGIVVGGVFGIAALSSKSFLASIGLGIPLVILVVAALLVLQTWSYTALIFAIKDSKERIGVVESFRRGWDKVRSVLWVSALLSATILGGFLLLAIPGIIFVVWFVFAIYIVIAENEKGLNALLKSREYVRGRWWGVVWRLVAFTLIYLPVFLIPTVLLTLAKVAWVTSVLNFVISVLLGIVGAVYYYLVYYHLRETKGEFSFAPSEKARKFFVFIAIPVSVLFLLAILALIAFLALRP
ncbi:MAG: hypothetical protein HYU80_00085 [Candidatus Blackburnbacteria bacterium]|nr:hypothetical protein [Candidatus Blackburnbacteria bacterium]